MREFSPLAVLVGIVVGALLGAAMAFVGLRVGMTVSASIPAAVMAILVLKSGFKRGTILESNMVQTVGSAGESLAGGMIFTIPALFILGAEPTYWEMVIWGTLGGMLGVCFMVPLRQVLIVREHEVLPYPEGIACAEVLHAGERGGASARPVISGALAGGIFFLLTELRFWMDTGRVAIRRFYTEAQFNSSPALLGVGYILGARIAAYMLSGAVLAWFLIIPAIGYFGASAPQPVAPATDMLIADMSPYDIWANYVRYIGAGAVAIGGLISLLKSMPTIASSFWHVATGLFGGGQTKKESTERDVPVLLLLLVIVGIAYAMWHFDEVRLDHVGVVAVLIAAFFFVTVSSRLVGIIGTSSNPISGMTIATLLGAALIYKFFVLDRAGPDSDVSVEGLQVTCIAVGAIVAIAIAVAADTSQDLKTGFLVKATPYKQQLGKTLGVLTSVAAVAGVILLLNKTYGFGVKTVEKPFPLLAPQANIMKILVESVLGGGMPWTLILVGGTAAVIVELLGLSALPVAVGLYLPLGLSTPIMLGGIVRWLVDRKRKEKSDHDPGVLTASGMVAGEGLMGVAIAGVTALFAALLPQASFNNPLGDPPGVAEPINPRHLVPWVWDKLGTSWVKWGLADAWWDALPLFALALLTFWLWWVARKRPPIILTPTSAPPAPQPRSRRALQPIPPLSSAGALRAGAGSAPTADSESRPSPRYKAASPTSPRQPAPAPQPPPTPEDPPRPEDVTVQPGPSGAGPSDTDLSQIRRWLSDSAVPPGDTAPTDDAGPVPQDAQDTPWPPIADPPREDGQVPPAEAPPDSGSETSTGGDEDPYKPPTS